MNALNLNIWCLCGGSKNTELRFNPTRWWGNRRPNGLIYFGTFLCEGSVLKAGDVAKGSQTFRWTLVASPHHSNCEKHRSVYDSQRSSSWMTLPSSSKMFPAFGIWIMAETGRHPSSDKIGRNECAARLPPHCPALYVTIADGLKPKVEDPKWFSTLRSPGAGAWLYSGVMVT